MSRKSTARAERCTKRRATTADRCFAIQISSTRQYRREKPEFTWQSEWTKPSSLLHERAKKLRKFDGTLSRVFRKTIRVRAQAKCGASRPLQRSSNIGSSVAEIREGAGRRIRAVYRMMMRRAAQLLTRRRKPAKGKLARRRGIRTNSRLDLANRKACRRKSATPFLTLTLPASKHEPSKQLVKNLTKATARRLKSTVVIRSHSRSKVQ
mmetsp:Transcript_12059/g.32464  ORF Transcript_12059/g.32464 Transcript_12059/m.32464 type:complete len:209 (-) Transcript_12059:1113-1739(-)